jgi:hypothetical protein
MTAMWWSIVVLGGAATFFSASLIAIASRSDRRRLAMPVRVVELPIDIGKPAKVRRGR